MITDCARNGNQLAVFNWDLWPLAGLFANGGYPELRDLQGNPVSGEYFPVNLNSLGNWGTVGFTPSPTLGVTRDAYGNYRHDYDISRFMPSTWLDTTVWDHWYIGSGGSDANAGTSESAPFRTFSKALTEPLTGACTGRVVWVEDDLYLDYGTGGSPASWNNNVPVGNCIVLPWSGINGGGTWTSSMECGGGGGWAQDFTIDPTGATYKQTFSVTIGTGCGGYDYTRIDYQGLPRAMLGIAADSKTVSTTNGAGVLIAVTTSASHGYTTGDTVAVSGVVGNTAANGTWVITVTGATTFTLNTSVGNGAYVSGGTTSDISLSARGVAATADTIFTNGNDVWVHLANAAAPTNTTFKVIRATTNGTRAMDTSTFLVLGGIFEGGLKPFGTQTYSAGVVGSSVFARCRFQRCSVRQTATSQNAFLYEQEGAVTLIGCTAWGGGKDGFNYRYCDAIEVGCESYYNGGYSVDKGDYYTSDSFGTNQCSTIHRDTRSIRVLGKYHHGNQNVYDSADVAATTCYSLNIGNWIYDAIGIEGVGKHNGDLGLENNGTLTTLTNVGNKLYDPETLAPSTSDYALIKNGPNASTAFYETEAPASADIRLGGAGTLTVRTF